MHAIATTLGLTEQQSALVRHYVESEKPDLCASAHASGYAPSVASNAKNWVTRTPALLAAIHLETARRVVQLAPGSLETVRAIEAGTITEGAKVRLDAAKTILAIAGHIAPRARSQGEGQERTLSEMSLDELKATQDRLQAEILNRAKPVNAQETVPTQGHDVDILS